MTITREELGIGLEVQFPSARNLYEFKTVSPTTEDTIPQETVGFFEEKAEEELSEPELPDIDGSVEATDQKGLYLRRIGKTALLTAEEEVELAKRIEAGLYAEQKLDTEFVWSHEYRNELAALASDGARAKEHFIEANLRLVFSLARKYQTGDLFSHIQNGNLGLIRAVEKFDYKSGYKFSTYATWWIKKKIMDPEFNDQRTIRLPAEAELVYQSLSKVTSDLAIKLGREPTEAELAAKLKLPPDRLRDIQFATKPMRSLEDPPKMHVVATKLADLIEELPNIDYAELNAREARAARVAAAMKVLDPIERRIVHLTMGFDNQEPMTFKDIATMMGVSRNVVGNLHAKALTKMRHPVNPHALTSSDAADTKWHQEAMCRKQNADAAEFFPKGVIGAAARMMCRSCVVQVECATAALDGQEQQGVWGGKGAGFYKKAQKQSA